MDITDERIIALTLYSLALGVVLGAVWMLFSFVRIVLSPTGQSDKARRLRAVVMFFTDFLYCVFAGICVVLLFFSANGGRVRLLGIVGCAVGAVAFHRLIGKRILRILSFTVDFVRSCLSFLWRHTFGWVFIRLARIFKKAFLHAKPKRIKKKSNRIISTEKI